ncbi:MAG: hypothetical protein JNL02_00770 [Saprospiraceae bacterium]|nr:hypothetical protein [Saprospiraceae bacterium]
MDKRDNLIDTFQTIYRWRKAIRNICLLALVGSVGFSLMLDNYYKASTTFYPTSPQLSNPELMFGASSAVTDYYGGDRELDRLLEIAGSNELAGYLISRFQLYQHYGIDSTSKDGAFKVREIFNGLYSVEKNKNDAIVVSMEDTDPKLAADIANAAREQINAIAQSLTKESQRRLLDAFNDNIKRKQEELVLLSDSMRTIQARYGIYDSEAQGEQLSEQLTLAEAGIVRNRARLDILQNNPLIPRDTVEYIKAELRASEQMRKQLLNSGDNLTIRRFNEGLPQVAILRDLHFQSRKQLSYDMERYNHIKASYNTDIPALLTVERAEVPQVKSRPKRSVIVIASVVAAFLFTLLAALLAENYRGVMGQIRAN